MRVEIPKFNEVEAGFEPVPVGRYTVLVSNAEIRAKKGGTAGEKFINWQLTILAPSHEGRIVWLMTSLKTEALWNLKSFLAAAGAKMDDTGFATEDVVGLKLDVNVEQDEYEGRIRNRISPPYYSASA